jgi:hypothetical protein
MVGEAIAGLSAIKTAFDLAKGLKEIDDATRRNAAVIELQEKILAAQAAQTALLERVSDLEKEIARFETWEREKKRYKLTDFGGGTFAYLLTPEEENAEPPHRICATCYQKGEKSILQFSHRSEGQDWFKCHQCNKQYVFGVYVSPLRDDDYEPSSF